jgi:Arc/MetJ family transcription regulator
VTKRLIDVDDRALEDARERLGTKTIKDTVNEALRRAAEGRHADLTHALDVLGSAELDDRADAWR